LYSVKNLFLNSYLAEEKKQLSSVVTKNRENLIQDRVNQADIKEQRILTTGLYSDNQLQKETMYSDLGILYQDLRKDFIIDEDTYQKKVRGIPETVQILEAKRDLNTDPVGTALKLNDINNYPEHKSKNTNHATRPIGIGMQGLDDLFCKLNFCNITFLYKFIIAKT
jgi:hypothetical protein